MFQRKYVQLLSVTLPLLILCLLTPPGAYAQDVADVPAVQKQVSRQEQRIKSLKAIAKSLQDAKHEISELQKELGSSTARGREEEIKQKIADFGERVSSLQHNFSEIATGVDISLFGVKKEDLEVDWQKEVETLLGPLLNEIKRLTSGPRELEYYRSQIDLLEEQQRNVSTALQNLGALEELQDEPKGALQKRLAQERNFWQDRGRQVETQLEIFRQKLNQKLSERRSVAESLRDIPALFFKSRGRNLLLALLATVLFWVALRKLQGQINRSMQSRGRTRSFRYRLFAVGYLFFTGVGSLFIFLIVLFFFGDWVLLILGVMFLLGLIWSSRQAIPRFWNQAALLLNLGPVREGERVIYQGVPWKVKTLSFYTTLENPDLDGGSLKLPIRDLTGLRSRESGDHERWFATRAGDWVLVADRFGKVIHQGVEQVRVVHPGGSIATFPTSEFLGMHPVTLSTGFRIGISFGLDYQHQAEITDVICKTMEIDVRSALLADFCDESQLSCNVEFQEAGASSLNLFIICDFRGELAPHYQKLKRKVAALAVEACNRHHWVIPFNQLTLHVEGNQKIA